MNLLDGKIVSQTVKDRLKIKTEERLLQGKKAPHLAAILIGNNGASETYVASKVKSCAEVGFKSTLIRLEETVTENELLFKINELNNDSDVDGILVQLPLPKHISEEKVIETIFASKDVDGFHPESVGRMVQGLPAFYPATPYGILLILEHYKIETKGIYMINVGIGHSINETLYVSCEIMKVKAIRPTISPFLKWKMTEKIHAHFGMLEPLNTGYIGLGWKAHKKNIILSFASHPHLGLSGSISLSHEFN